MKNKLGQIQSPWRRFLITLVIHLFVLMGQLSGPRARIHWLGHHNRPRRRERLLGALLVLGAMLVLNPHQFAFWSAVWGGFFAIFLNLYMIYRLVPYRMQERL